MSDYVAIDQDTLVENTKVGCDLYLKGYVNGAPKYVLFCRGDEQFSNNRREELVKKNVGKLFIPSEEYKKYFEYQEKTLPIVLKSGSVSSKEKSSTVYKVAKNLANDLLKDARTGINMDRVTNWVDSTIDYVLEDEDAFANLLQVTSHDYHTYTHSVNMAVFGLLFSKHLSMNIDDQKTLGIGMLLHDLGKVEVPLEIINKPGKLTKEEFETIKKHPENGIRMLKNKKLSAASLKIVIQHHENYDSTGYPNKIGGGDIHLFGRIARILDVYDAITTKRSYKDAMRSFAGLREMKESMIRCFDKKLFREFITFLGPADPRKAKRSERS